jgi:hypothetical protein
MPSLTLTSYLSIGQEISAGVFSDSTGSTPGVNGANSMADAATAAATYVGLGSPEGVEFEIKLIYTDQTNPALQPVWETMVASYSLDVGVYKWTRVRTIASSDGTTAVTFAAGTNNLKILGTNSNEQSGAVYNLETLTSGISASLAGDQSLAAGVSTKILFSVDEWDIGNENAAGTFTAATAGYRLTLGQCTFKVAAADDSLKVYIKVNGVEVQQFYAQSTNTQYTTVPFSKMLLLSVADTVEIWGENVDSADELTSTDTSTFWQIIQPYPGS